MGMWPLIASPFNKKKKKTKKNASNSTVCASFPPVPRSGTLLGLSSAVVSVPATQANAATCRCESERHFYKLKVLVCITFLSRYNLFIQYNVLLQPVANPTGILPCKVCHPCSLRHTAMGLSAPQTSPEKGTRQQLFSKQSESLYKSHGGNLQIWVDSIQVSLQGLFCINLHCGEIGWICLVSISLYSILPHSHCLLFISIGA